MFRNVFFALVASLLVGTPAVAFEGVLQMTTTIAQLPPITSVVSMRENGDTRTDSVVPQSGEMVSVIQKASGAMVTLMHASRTYVEAVPAASPSASLEDMTITQLGTEAIAGYPCKHARLLQKNGTTFEVWMSKDFGARAAQGMAQEMLRFLAKNQLEGFPLKMAATHQGQSMTVETIKVEARKLDPSLFEKPASYGKASPAAAK